MRGVELPFVTVPPELLLAGFLAMAALFAWRSFATPFRGLLVVLAALPLLKTVAHEGVLARFAPPDVFVALTAAGTAVVLARRRDAAWGSVRIPREVLLGGGAFAAAALLSVLASEDVGRSAVELAAYGVNAVLFALLVFHVRTREALFTCVRAWEIGVVIAVLGSVAGVALLFAGNLETPLTEGPKLASTFKKSGQLSAYLLPSFPLLWFARRELSTSRRARALRGLLIAAAYASLVATGSRTGLALGTAILAALFAGSWLRTLLGRQTLLRLGVAVAALAAVVPAAGDLASRLPYSFQRAFSVLDGVSSLERMSPTRYYQFQGWQVAAAERPWLGVGTGDFKTRATSLVPAAWHAHEVHNTYLGVWAETGIPGIAALAVLYLGILRAAWQVIGRGDRSIAALGFALLVALGVLYLYGISNFGLRMRHLWCVFGLVVAAGNVVLREGARPGPA